jgi:anti-sigma B factor antagonist
MQLSIGSRAGSDGARILAVGGDLDLATSARLLDAVTVALDDGATTVVLDLDEMTFVDSTGLGALVTCVKRAHERERGLAIVVPEDSPLTRLLALTGLQDALPVQRSLGPFAG